MNLEDIKAVNRLWQRVYPYLVAQIMEEFKRESGSVLELGPFSGGISMEMARLYPGLDITIADEPADVVSYLRQEVETSGLGEVIKVEKTELHHPAFADGQLDLIVIRGAFFFLNEDLLLEIFRLLKAGGMAFVGGGYGKDIPQQLIDEIHDRSQVLNQRLGRRWVSIEELKEMVDKTGLSDNCRIVKEGGLWLSIRK